MICNIFSHFVGSLYFPDGALWSTKVLKFWWSPTYVIFKNFFYFSCHIQETITNLWSQRPIPMFASMNFMVLALTARSFVHLGWFLLTVWGRGSTSLLHMDIQLFQHKSSFLGLINLPGRKKNVSPLPPSFPRYFLQPARRNCRAALGWSEQGLDSETRKPRWKAQSVVHGSSVMEI